MKIYYIHQEDNLELDNDERLNRIDDVFQSERELVLAGITDELFTASNLWQNI